MNKFLVGALAFGLTLSLGTGAAIAEKNMQGLDSKNFVFMNGQMSGNDFGGRFNDNSDDKMFDDFGDKSGRSPMDNGMMMPFGGRNCGPDFNENRDVNNNDNSGSDVNSSASESNKKRSERSGFGRRRGFGMEPKNESDETRNGFKRGPGRFEKNFNMNKDDVVNPEPKFEKDFEMKDAEMKDFGTEGAENSDVESNDTDLNDMKPVSPKFDEIAPDNGDISNDNLKQGLPGSSPDGMNEEKPFVNSEDSLQDRCTVILNDLLKNEVISQEEFDLIISALSDVISK